MTDQKRPTSAIYAGLDKTEEMPPAGDASEPCEGESVVEGTAREGSSPEAAAAPEKPRSASGNAPSAPTAAPRRAEGASAAGASARQGKGTKIAIAVIAVISLAIIAVSAFSLAGGFVSSSQETSAQSVFVAGVDAAADSAEAQDGDAADAAQADGDSTDPAAAADGEQGPSADAGGASGAATGSQNASASSSQNAASSGGSEPSSSNPGGTTQAPAPPATFAASLSFSSEVEGMPISFSTSVTVSQGDTVYDALVKSGISHNAEPSPFGGVYITSIGGVAAQDDTGWTYYVNGQYINASCSSTTLSEGDSVQWVYVRVASN